MRKGTSLISHIWGKLEEYALSDRTYSEVWMGPVGNSFLCVWDGKMTVAVGIHPRYLPVSPRPKILLWECLHRTPGRRKARTENT